MKIIDCDWIKRNGNGHSTCHLCKTLTWDSFCYDFELKILDKELFNTVLCGDCISKIRQELECKKVSNEKILEEVEDKEYEDIEELKIEQMENNPSCYYIKNEFGTKCCLTKHSKIIADKVNELVRNQKYILGVLNKEEL